MRNAQIPQRELNGTEDITFALDIGTRSVVGIIGIIEDDNFEVIDFEQQFHAKRAMRDGQIEDIGLVAKVVGEVKTKLEERNNLKLNKVAIAAAGRSLKTIKIVYEQTIDMKEEITHESMNGMEYAALSQ
ncbi:MAG: cell division protein FtsA, partial [Oscillospiraceae bacterium]